MSVYLGHDVPWMVGPITTAGLAVYAAVTRYADVSRIAEAHKPNDEPSLLLKR
jgi:hypothetical protein